MEDHVEACTKGEPISQACFVDDFDFSPLLPDTEFKSIAIVVTPVCDFVQDKVDYVTFCGVMSVDDWLKTLDPTKMDSQMHDLTAGRVSRYHWIGTLPGRKGFYFVDYQVCMSVHLKIANTLKPFAKSTSPFAESIITGHARNFSRIGLRYEKTEQKQFAKDALERFKELNAQTATLSTAPSAVPAEPSSTPTEVTDR